MRGLEFWKNYTYRVKFELYNPEKKELETQFVTQVDHVCKTFEYRNAEELVVQKKKIKLFHLEEAVELMNCMFCNGYIASIEPYFEN